MAVQNIKEMTVYQKAYRLAMQAFEISKRFPAEERYALTGQLRHSSRSVCLNLREAWLPASLPAPRASRPEGRVGYVCCICH